jgi:hypothetical protein
MVLALLTLLSGAQQQELLRLLQPLLNVLQLPAQPAARQHLPRHVAWQQVLILDLPQQQQQLCHAPPPVLPAAAAGAAAPVGPQSRAACSGA